ncbi:HTH-type transcriptional repressor ComR [mine drainage metagenome]|uniref:HTH-type transcriptional repressor ComR n=1 Tax=mine drainage metagenome TaxID=410659 RepID=A0A1J5SM64_9ZZZZ
MGRPAEFEREKVLEKAMHAFWDCGYGDTGVSQLSKVTRLKPGSLYGAFESKEALFLEALESYGKASVKQVKAALAGGRSPLGAIRTYFMDLAAEAAGPYSKRSCLLVNTVLELARKEPKIQAHVNRQFEAIEEVLREALVRAKKAGELQADADPAALAAYLITSIWGLRVLGGTAPEPGRAKAVARQILAALT